MASRIVQRKIIKDHDKGSMSQEIIIESGENISADETTPQAEAFIKTFSRAEVPKMLSSMSGMFAELEKMLEAGENFPFFTSKEVTEKVTSKKSPKDGRHGRL